MDKEKTPVSKNFKDASSLINTGLLNGYKVVYIGTKKKDFYGIIQNDGIVCLCSKCEGKNVKPVPPATFERHICRGHYYGATKYIFFENKKSLSLDDLVKACNNVRKWEAEMIIQDHLGALKQMSALSTSSSSKSCSKFKSVTLYKELEDKDVTLQARKGECECLKLKISELEKKLQISESNIERRDAEQEELREKLKASERKQEQTFDLLEKEGTQLAQLEVMYEDALISRKKYFNQMEGLNS